MDLQNKMSPHDIFSIPLFGHEIPVTDTVIIMWIIMAFLIIFAFVFTRKLDLIPRGKQNFIEVVVDAINSFTKGNLGHHWKHFAPYLGTLIMFLIMSNTISIFDVIPAEETLYHLTHIESLEHFAIRPPTKDINVTVCLAVMSIILVVFSGIRFKSVSGWLKGLFKPTPVMFIFNVLDYFIRPMSLSLRLFGNILGAFIVMQLLYGVFPPILPAAFSLYFDLFDGILQAYIFVFLTSIYIAEAIE